MRAAVYSRFGGPEQVRVEEVPKPGPGAGDLLVRVHATTVSAADHRMRSRRVPRGLGLLVGPTLGFFRPRRQVLGMNAAGVVEAVGEQVTTFGPGDEVVASLAPGFGGHAEYVVVPAGGVVARKPAGVSFEDSAALVFGGLTALDFLGRADVSSGRDVLVNGATGSVGSAAVQLAANQGARVTAVCSGSGRDVAMSLGATSVIDYTVEDFTGGGRAYDVVVDCVGNAPWRRVKGCIGPGGALLLVVSDLRGQLGAALKGRRSGRLVTAGGLKSTSDDLAHLLHLAAEGHLRPAVDRTYDLDQIVEAHRYVDTWRKKGNVVVRIGVSGQTGDPED